MPTWAKKLLRSGVRPVLDLESVEVSYGAVRALRGISLTVEDGEVFSVIGANGAGKSTLMRAIAGLTPCRAGAVRFRGKDITRLEAHKRVELGISLVPEGRGVFPDFTVRENLMIGAYLRRNDREVQGDLSRVLRLFPRLEERSNQVAKTMSGGEQQMLAIGRALMTRPQTILMDEPSMGLAPMVVREIFEVIRQLQSDGVTILLVEQNARKALEVATHAAILELGQVLLTDRASDLVGHPRVKQAYLGG